MKNLICISFVFFSGFIAAAQSVAINTDASLPNASAMLDIKSINKGLLIPRMTTAQRTAIATPAKGLIVFDITTNGLWFHNGTAWNVLSSGSSTNYWSVNGNDIYNNNAGNVGIGTTAPAAYGHGGNNKITEISNLNTGSNIQSHLILSTNGTSGSAGGITWASQGVPGTEKRLGFIGDVYETSNAARMVFYTRDEAGTLGERLTVLGNGNTGIGLSAPRARLTVLSTSINSANNTEVMQVAGKNPMLLFSDINGNDYAYFKAITDLSQTAQFARPGIEIGAAGNDIYLSSLGYQPALTVNGTTNNVGIGTITPLAKLHIAGNVKIDGNNTLEFGAGVNGKEASAGKIGYQTFKPDALDIVGAGTTGLNRKIKFWNEGGAEFAGSVGIGYANPVAGYKLSTNGGAYINGPLFSTGDVEIGGDATVIGKLKVYAWGPYTYTHNSYGMGETGDGVIYNGSGFNVSINAAQSIIASSFLCISDARLKNIAGVSNSVKDLETINALQITDYTMKDKLMYGSKSFKKVIAQEVEKIYPQVISKHPDFIPNVYQQTNTIEKTSNGYLLSFANKHNLEKTAKKIQLMMEHEAKQFDIIAIPSANQVEIKAADFKIDKVFVYGQEVDDFRSVDYEGLTTLNISATQELSKLIDAQNKKIEMLIKEIELLKGTKLAALEIK